MDGEEVRDPVSDHSLDSVLIGDEGTRGPCDLDPCDLETPCHKDRSVDESCTIASDIVDVTAFVTDISTRRTEKARVESELTKDTASFPSTPCGKWREGKTKPNPLSLSEISRATPKLQTIFSPDTIFGQDVEIIDLCDDSKPETPTVQSLGVCSIPSTPNPRRSKGSKAPVPSLLDTPTPSFVVPRRRKRELSPLASVSNKTRVARPVQAARIDSAGTSPGIGFKTPPLTLGDAPLTGSFVEHLSAKPTSATLPRSTDKASIPSSLAPAPLFLPSTDHSTPLEKKLFSIKPLDFTPWTAKEYHNLAKTILESFPVHDFATSHGRSIEDVRNVLSFLVIRPIHQKIVAPRRTNAGISDLAGLFSNYSTPTRTWAKGSGYEMVGKIDAVRMSEVVVVGKCVFRVDDGGRGGEGVRGERSEGRERVVIPVQVLTGEDFQHLYGTTGREERKQVNLSVSGTNFGSVGLDCMADKSTTGSTVPTSIATTLTASSEASKLTEELKDNYARFKLTEA